ncbi:MAG: M56 family metallopeptidase [Anaerostipes sp.]|nr:M56 family metallopeptidase [Anaerostipes sp.]MDD3746855.1 M56 family metallopeptidase [Anaerostipes sp.]
MSYQMIDVVFKVYILFGILQNIFSVVILTSLTGCVFFIFWIPLSKRIELEGNPKQAYFILKVIIVAHLIPVMYLLVKRFDGYSIFDETPNVFQIVLTILTVVWTFGFIRQLKKYYQEHKKIKRIIAGCHICRRDVAAIAHECMKRAGCQREIKIYQGDLIPVPMAYGVINSMILLPDAAYTKSQLEVILLHELEHCKHHDLFWIYLNNIATCIHWFNPVVKVIGRQLDQWSEIYCDLYVLNITSSIKRYYREVIQIAAKFSSQRTSLACALFEDMTELESRMKRVIKIRKNGKCSLPIAILYVVVFCLLSTASVSATTIGYYRGYKGMKDAMTEEVEMPTKKIVILKEKVQEQPDVIQWDDTHTILFKKKDVETFGWTLKSRTGKISDTFYVTKGEQIELGVLTAQKDDHVAEIGQLRVGIMNEKGRQRYVTEKNDMDAEFTIKESGNYRLFTENLSKWTMQIGGFITKER